MSIHVGGSWLTRTESGGASFEGLREVEGMVGCTRRDGRPTGLELLRSTKIWCRERGEVCTADCCLACKRFVNFVPSADFRRLKVRCYWCESDPASAVMTRVASLATAPLHATAADLIALAHDSPTAYVLIVDHDRLIGVVSSSELDPSEPGDAAAQHRERRIWLARVDASIGEVAAIINEHRARCVLLVDEHGDLAGLITPEDLRDIGWSG